MLRTKPTLARCALLAAIVGIGLAPGSAQAATTWHVTTAGDPASGSSCPSASQCSLRAAVKDAHDGDTIVVPAYHIKLNSTLDINQSITITGAGAGKTVLDGRGANRVISVIGPAPTYLISNASLTLRSLTVTGGSVTRANAGQNAGGAGIQNNSNGTLYLVKVTVTGNAFTATGTTGEDVGGGGILSLSTVDLASSTISHNHLTVAGSSGLDGGGGVMVEAGDLIAASSHITANTASIAEQPSAFGGNGGGGLMLGNQGGDDVILEGTTVSQNEAHILSGNGIGDGGGGLLQAGAVSVLSTGSTFAGNVADLTGDTGAGGGGAVLDAGGGSAYTDTTFANNSVQDSSPATQQGGGAIFYADSTISSLANDSLAGNTPDAGSGASIYDAGTRVVVKNTILSRGSSTSANCAQDSSIPGTVVSNGYNLYDDASDSCGLTGTGDHHVASLHLGALAENGGPVPTLALQAGSPAINAGDLQGCTDSFGHPLTTDARGVSRPQPHGRRCDVGAYERAPAMADTALAGAVGPGRATLQGTAVNPDALAGTAHFEYGKTTKYAKATAPRPVGAFATVTVQAALTKLPPGTYHYRLVVTNHAGTARGLDSTFVVPPGGSGSRAPKVITGPAESITSKTAKLTGKLDDYGVTSFYEFEWGSTEKYGHKTELKSAGSKKGMVNASQVLKRLKPGHVYHYRLLVVSSSNPTFGADRRFTTSG